MARREGSAMNDDYERAMYAGMVAALVVVALLLAVAYLMQQGVI